MWFEPTVFVIMDDLYKVAPPSPPPRLFTSANNTSSVNVNVTCNCTGNGSGGTSSMPSVVEDFVATGVNPQYLTVSHTISSIVFVVVNGVVQREETIATYLSYTSDVITIQSDGFNLTSGDIVSVCYTPV
jgi:hypothetical protein